MDENDRQAEMERARYVHYEEVRKLIAKLTF